MTCEQCEIKEKKIIELEEQLKHQKKKPVYTCPRMVSSNKARSIHRLIKRIDKDPHYSEGYEALKDYIKTIDIESTFTKTDILQFEKLLGLSEGDLAHKFCEYEICLGHIKKEKFGLRDSHIYKKESTEQCPFLMNKKRKNGNDYQICTCDDMSLFVGYQKE